MVWRFLPPFFAVSKIIRVPARISTQGNKMGEEGVRGSCPQGEGETAGRTVFWSELLKTEESLAGFVDRMLGDRLRTLPPGFAEQGQFIWVRGFCGNVFCVWDRKVYCYFLNSIFILYRRLLIYSVVLVSGVRKVIQLPILFQILFLYRVMTKYWVGLPVLYSRSLLVIYFLYSSVYMLTPDS